MSNTQLNQVLDKLIQAKLVRCIPGETQGDGQIELVHEALIYNWPRYQTWLEDEQLKRYKRLRLVRDAQDWESQERSPALLWRGQMLQEAKSYGNLSELETAFVTASEETLIASKLREEKLHSRLRDLSKHLKVAKHQEKSLREQLKSLEFASEEASLYKRKSRRYLLLIVLLLMSTLIAIGIAVAQSQGEEPQAAQGMSGLALNEHQLQTQTLLKLMRNLQ